ncbi:hypothetical protein FNV43_RR17259 [Rhamnella rubrinervis]|uniref:Filament-like plant protein 7 n=1 Tax=Rhamnella rubrinervis TaxID=2594499 RepID=A0A8K0GUN5_9ROSA|nr:hypothetical protein FNV43_RR17259 [Rhamnella rubrinervis]
MSVGGDRSISCIITISEYAGPKSFQLSFLSVDFLVRKSIQTVRFEEMDNKAWLWRKKSIEKTSTLATDKSLKGNEEEIQILLDEKEELEKDLKTLNEKLSTAVSECDTKDELVRKHAKMAQEAVKGWEKAEAEAVSLKLQRDEALQHKVSGEERLAHLDAALKECMQQLRHVREEQEKRIHDAVMKTSREFEKSQMVLEEKLAEANKRHAKVVAENAHLSKALSLKEKLIEELNRQLNQLEADFNALMTRLESTEKDNSSFKYEVRVLEKELEIRNEEREFNRRTADASHKQHLESVKKIAKLESECQRLRLLVRKRLPGPAALAKMRNEVEMLGKDSVEMRRKSNPTGLMFDSTVDNASETPIKRISILTEQLCIMEEENKTLRELLVKKTNELQISRNMYARTASKLSQVDSHPEESPKGLSTMEPIRSNIVPHEVSLASMSDIGSDDKASCADSWASALVSELEHFRAEKQKGSLSSKIVGASDINLMDDFVEMEKLAVVSVNKPTGDSLVSSNEANTRAGPFETEYSPDVVGSEIVPLSDSESSFNVSNQEMNFKVKLPVWLQGTLKLVLEQNHATGRNPQDLLEDIRVALAHMTHPKPDASSYYSGEIQTKFLAIKSSREVTDVDIPVSEKSNQQFQSDLSKSISKMIELIEGISLPSPDYDKNSETPMGYMVRVFQWKTSELGAVLQQYVHACYDLLNGKVDIDKFAQELTTALDWIINHCFSLQDVSSMRYAIKKQFDWDDTRSENEAEIGMMGHFLEPARVPREQLSYLTSSTASDAHCIQTEDLRSTVVENNRKLKAELVNMESAKKELEGRLQSATDRSEYLMNQLQESEKVIASLKTKLQDLRESKGKVKDQTENHKMVYEDLDAQLTVARAELNDARQKLSSLEVELENKSNCYEELEGTCIELQLQLESLKKESLNSDPNQEQTQLRTDMEITAASEKLAECQETIFNLGKQLKALAAPREAALFDKVISNPTDANPETNTITTIASPIENRDKNMYRRPSLLDQMLAEDVARAKDLKSPDTKEVDGNSTTLVTNETIKPLEKILVLNSKHHDEDAVVAVVDSLAIVPSKKRGGGSLWRKLLWKKKKSNSKKAPLSLVA